MDLDREAAIVKRAARTEYLDLSEVRRWLEFAIKSLEDTPAWLAEASTVHTRYVEDVLREMPQLEASGVEIDLDIAISCYLENRGGLDALWWRLWKLLLHHESPPSPPWAETLAVLVDWRDQLEEPESLPDDLRQRFLAEIGSLAERFCFREILGHIRQGPDGRD